MKKLFSTILFVCLFALGMHAQPTQTDPGYPAAFDQAYWLAQPAAVRNLAKLDDQNARSTQAAVLAMQGFTVDVPIDVYGWEPYLVMKLRQDFGYTWVPSALQAPVAIAPGLSAPGAVPYDPQHPPAGAIKVSTDIKDFPAFEPPPQPAPLILTANYVGAQSIGNLYFALAGDPTPDGGVVKDARGTFVKHKVQTPFGFSAYYEKQ